MLRKTLVVGAALIFGSAVSGQAQDMMKGEMMKGEMTKFTVRTKTSPTPTESPRPMARTWPFAFSPGLWLSTRTTLRFLRPAKKIAATVLRPKRRTEILHAWRSRSKAITAALSRRESSIHLWAKTSRHLSLRAGPTNLPSRPLLARS